MTADDLRDDSVVGHVTLRYWAAARAAAGVETDVIGVGGPVDLASLVAEALRRHGGSPRFPDVLASCSVLVGDQPVASRDPSAVRVAPGEQVEFLPPFAGG